jgi:hypothetical protein
VYILLIVVLVAVGGAVVFHGVRGERRWEIGLGVLLLAATLAFFLLLGTWGEMLWFQALGFGQRFWTETGGFACSVSMAPRSAQ